MRLATITAAALYNEREKTSQAIRKLVAQRDELLAALKKAQPMVFQWEHRVYHGKTELADEITSLIAKCEAAK